MGTTGDEPPAFAVGDRVLVTPPPDCAAPWESTVRGPGRYPGTVDIDRLGGNGVCSVFERVLRRLDPPAPQPAPVVTRKPHAQCVSGEPCKECEGYGRCRCDKCPASQGTAEAQRAERRFGECACERGRLCDTFHAPRGAAPESAPPPLIPDYPALCPCGSPCVELLLTRECSRGKACEGKRPEVEIVATFVEAYGRVYEPHWVACAVNFDVSAVAATEEVAIAAVRRRLEER